MEIRCKKIIDDHVQRKVVAAEMKNEVLVWVEAVHEHDAKNELQQLYKIQHVEKGQLVSLECALPISPDFIVSLDSSFLLVQSRCGHNHRVMEHNALIINRKGETVKTFSVGDGITGLVVNCQGLIWCTYADEGIFGVDDSVIPIGREGVAVFTLEGVQVVNPLDLQLIDTYSLTLGVEEEIFIFGEDTSCRKKLFQIRDERLIASCPVTCKDVEPEQLSYQEGFFIGAEGAQLYRLELKKGALHVQDSVTCVDEEGSLLTGLTVIGTNEIGLFNDDGRIFIGEWGR
ncbi:hypothetical protein [Alkalihalobacillus pseudalcaliphilus]|uniref:hypothetical protein n=1 Tax=Alkalihalobacillus pseudalcaliphilus TaxID=79884 RepID=UPI00064D76F5|nr:hypothetical protein [Alkalihalobacillus pseudalcaliphilus]KMK75886.1 hypothetical protein AB990_11535 [Alkalihalobacillus pseudalcaliphilus]